MGNSPHFPHIQNQWIVMLSLLTWLRNIHLRLRGLTWWLFFRVLRGRLWTIHQSSYGHCPGANFIELLTRTICLADLFGLPAKLSYKMYALWLVVCIILLTRKICLADLFWLPAKLSYKMYALWLVVCFILLSKNILLSSCVKLGPGLSLTMLGKPGHPSPVLKPSAWPT